MSLQVNKQLLRNFISKLYNSQSVAMNCKIQNHLIRQNSTANINRSSSSPCPRTSSPTTNRLDVAALDAFYFYSFPAHPFVLPKEYFLLADKDVATAVLRPAMHWVGSLFLPVNKIVRDEFFDKAYSLVCDPLIRRNGYLAQAMLILVIGLDGTCKRDAALQLLSKLEKLAIEIGLNSHTFAVAHGNGSVVLEETWRRTWWEVYVVDGIMAGMHRVSNFALYTEETDVELPCEEYQYLDGNIPIPLHLDDLEDEGFCNESKQFSSFAYRIICIHNLGKFLHIQPISKYDKEAISSIERLLRNWQLHLPHSKRDAIQANGKYDEMMFQAHMIFHANCILLHQPLSELNTSTTIPTINSCASASPKTAEVSNMLHDVYSKHAIAAASAVSDLVTHRTAMLCHSHFFVYMMSLSSIVHLRHWILSSSLSPTKSEAEDEDSNRFCENIKLNIGALKTLAQVWPVAEGVLEQVQSMAQEIYKIKKGSQSEGQQVQTNSASISEQALVVDDRLWQMWSSLNQV